MSICRPSFIVFIGLIFAFSASISAQDFVIKGKVTSTPHMVHPRVKVAAMDNLGDTIASVYTDESGDYTLEYSTVDVMQPSAQTAVMQIVPNPFSNHAKLKVYVDSDAEYFLSVHNASGNLLLNKPLSLSMGHHMMDIYLQGPSGIYLFCLVGQGTNSWVRALHLSYGHHNRDYRVDVSLPVLTQADNTEKHASHAGEKTNELRLVFLGDNHHHKDTLVSRQDHTGMDVLLQQIPSPQESQYKVLVKNNFEELLKNATIEVFGNKEKTDTIFTGNTNEEGILEKDYENDLWIWETDTIKRIDTLYTEIRAEIHGEFTSENAYTPLIDFEAVLDKLQGEQQLQLNITLKNNPMDQFLAHEPITIKNENGDILKQGTLNQHGTTQFILERKYEVQATDTLFEFQDIVIPLMYEHHQEETLTKNFAPGELEINHTLQQIKYQDQATLRVSLTSKPLNFHPTGASIRARYANNEISNEQTNNGEANLDIPYAYYRYKDAYLNMINNEEITQPIQILIQYTQHEDKNIEKEFSHNMTINTEIQQIPEQKNSNIQGQVTEQGTNQNIPDVNVTLKEQQNQVYEATQTTNTNQNGDYEFNMQYTEYMNPDNTNQVLRIPANIKLKFEKNSYATITTNPIQTQPNIQHNQTLESLIQEYQFTITPYTFDNAHMQDVLDEAYTLHIKNLTTGETQSIRQTGTQPLQVTLQGQPSDELEIWHLHEELADLTVIQHNQQKWYEENVAQNRPIYLWDHTQPFYKVTTTIEHITNPEWNNALELYTPRYHLTTTDGHEKTFNGEIIYMIEGRGPIGGVVKNRTRQQANNPNAPGLEIFIWAYDFTTGQPIPQNKLDEMITINNNMLQHTTTPTGRVLLPTQTYIVHDMSQPEVIAAQNRNWTYTTNTLRKSGPPGNSMNFDLQSLTIIDSYSSYSVVTGTPTILEEQLESFIGSIDPENTSTSNYITAYGDNGIATLNLLGITMFKTPLLVDVGTWTAPPNKTTKSTNELKKEAIYEHK